MEPEVKVEVRWDEETDGHSILVNGNVVWSGAYIHDRIPLAALAAALGASFCG